MKEGNHVEDDKRPVAVPRELLRQRSRATSTASVGAALIGAAVLFVILTIHFVTGNQNSKISVQRAKIADLEHQVDRGRQLEGDVAVLKQQLRDLNIAPAVPDRQPIDSTPSTTTTTVTTVKRATTATTTATTRPTTTTTTRPSPPPSSPPTSQPTPTTTAPPPQSPPTTSCLALGLICHN